MSAALHLAPVGPEAAESLQSLHAPLFDPPWSVDALRDQLAAPESAAVAAYEAETTLAGFVLFRTMVDEAEILILAVAPERRRRGVGRALLDVAAALASARGAATLWLEVATDNAPR